MLAAKTVKFSELPASIRSALVDYIAENPGPVRDALVKAGQRGRDQRLPCAGGLPQWEGISLSYGRQILQLFELAANSDARLANEREGAGDGKETGMKSILDPSFRYTRGRHEHSRDLPPSKARATRAKGSGGIDRASQPGRQRASRIGAGLPQQNGEVMNLGNCKNCCRTCRRMQMG